MIVRSHSILLDAEALSALVADERRLQAWATVARRTDSTLHASTVTLAEVTDGTSRDAGVRRVAKSLRLEVVTDEIGYRAGRLRAVAASTRRKPRDLTVDAVVAATALALPAPVVLLTSDPDDLRLLLADTAVKVERIG
ncbi:PIN domain-containing protein [Nocardioides speluncae]|uniref:PIN domain-containing protein n=1 Tax=Nocardioides speluncae TaxID=2670337 RepID=UPI0023E8AD0F|nr:PIN domain-containing protein [Nocardioides speluncae]